MATINRDKMIIDMSKKGEVEIIFVPVGKDEWYCVTFPNIQWGDRLELTSNVEGGEHMRVCERQDWDE